MPPKPIRRAEEGRDRDLVGGIERSRRAAAGLQRVDREAERRKALEIRPLEGQAAEGSEIRRPNPRDDPVGIGEAMRDRRAHVGRRHAGDQRAVGEGDQAVDDRLRMDDDVEPLDGRPKRKCASISSSPLFIRPAESTVTFGPMTQFGCVSASSRVARAMRSALHSRNGPPDAVIVIISIVSGSRAPIAWNSALCSEFIGSSIAPARFAISHHRGAGADQGLLVGERDGPPGRERREGRLETGRADDGGHDQIRFAQRRLPHGVNPRGGLDAGTGERRPQIRVARRIGDRGEFGAEFESEPPERRPVAPGGDRGDREPAGRRRRSPGRTTARSTRSPRGSRAASAAARLAPRRRDRRLDRAHH